MRLLHTSTFCLQEFIHPPDYAILSHTWGAEEVTYQDLVLGDHEHMKGWSKVVNCCRKAAEDGWDFVWMDTCCIDKSSSAELQEAINSMFRWYEDSGICYAFLQDVQNSCVAGDDTSFEEQFVQSRWHTRGWCLQELLAPKFLLFLDQNWAEIGTRSSLSDLITQATNIIGDVIVSFRRGCNTAQIFSWASSRQTTRVEDRAYSLLGLCNVELPLLYGEGEKSFLRLQLEIIKSSDDMSIFAWIGRSFLSW